MNFLKKLFKPKSENSEPQPRSPLDTLSYAIADAGLWTWYNAELPAHLQLEFDHTLLFLPPQKEGQHPSHKITLQFDDVICVWAMSDEDHTLPEDLSVLFKNGASDSYPVDYEYFSFDPSEIRKIVEKAENAESVFGTDEIEILKNPEYKKVGFMANGVGAVVVAKRMLIISYSGEVTLASIPDVHQQWWGYWNQYWAKRETDTKMPPDFLCEITLPFKID